MYPGGLAVTLCAGGLYPHPGTPSLLHVAVPPLPACPRYVASFFPVGSPWIGTSLSPALRGISFVPHPVSPHVGRQPLSGNTSVG